MEYLFKILASASILSAVKYDLHITNLEVDCESDVEPQTFKDLLGVL